MFFPPTFTGSFFAPKERRRTRTTQLRSPHRQLAIRISAYPRTYAAYRYERSALSQSMQRTKQAVQATKVLHSRARSRVSRSQAACLGLLTSFTCRLTACSVNRNTWDQPGIMMAKQLPAFCNVRGTAAEDRQHINMSNEA